MRGRWRWIEAGSLVRRRTSGLTSRSLSGEDDVVYGKSAGKVAWKMPPKFFEVGHPVGAIEIVHGVYRRDWSRNRPKSEAGDPSEGMLLQAGIEVERGRGKKPDLSEIGMEGIEQEDSLAWHGAGRNGENGRLQPGCPCVPDGSGGRGRRIGSPILWQGGHFDAGYSSRIGDDDLRQKLIAGKNTVMDEHFKSGERS